MNGRGYRGRYRPVRRRRGISPLVVIISVVLAALLILFIIIGNVLNKKTQAPPKTTTGVTTDTEAPKPVPPSYKCVLLDIEGGGASQTQSNITKLAGGGATALSVKAKGADKTLLYSSTVAKSFGKPTASSLEMSTLVSRAKGQGMHVSVYFSLDFASVENVDVRLATLGYESALVSELFASGVDDVIISSPDIKLENIDELCGFAENVRSANKNATLGIALSSELYASAESAIAIDKLLEVYDILGLDLSKAPSEDTAKYIEGALSGNLYYILRYNARVILPSLPDAAASAAIGEVISSNSITNYQYVN